MDVVHIYYIDLLGFLLARSIHQPDPRACALGDDLLRTLENVPDKRHILQPCLLEYTPYPGSLMDRQCRDIFLLVEQGIEKIPEYSIGPLVYQNRGHLHRGCRAAIWPRSNPSLCSI
jgi:hypothetical protein